MRILAGLISLGRFVFGVAFIAEPKLMERGWIGKQARLPGAQLLTRAVGARDLALGLGGLHALTRNCSRLRKSICCTRSRCFFRRLVTSESKSWTQRSPTGMTLA